MKKVSWHLLVLVLLCAALGWGSRRTRGTVSPLEEQVLGWMPRDVTHVSIVRPDRIPACPVLEADTHAGAAAGLELYTTRRAPPEGRRRLTH